MVLVIIKAPYNGPTTFNGISSNGGKNEGSITGTTTFNDSSYNGNGTITGYAVFNDSSQNHDAITSNYGTVIGTARFNGDLSENGGVVTGKKTRHYTSNIAPTRDFVTDGPWRIIADGAVVDMTHATYDTTGDASTTVFRIKNCGHGSFIPTSIVATVTGTQCSSPNSPSTPTTPPVSYSSSGGSVSSAQLASLLAPGPATDAYLRSRGLSTTNPSNCPTGFTCTPQVPNSNIQAPNNNQITNPNSLTSTFTRNLQTGSVGTDVKALQKFLNSHNFIITKTGPGSPGNETTKFGLLTKTALIKFQKSNNISPAIGYFGPITRGFVEGHYQMR